VVPAPSLGTSTPRNRDRKGRDLIFSLVKPQEGERRSYRRKGMGKFGERRRIEKSEIKRERAQRYGHTWERLQGGEKSRGENHRESMRSKSRRRTGPVCTHLGIDREGHEKLWKHAGTRRKGLGRYDPVLLI